MAYLEGENPDEKLRFDLTQFADTAPVPRGHFCDVALTPARLGIVAFVSAFTRRKNAALPCGQLA
jgi:hypothetical protein